MRKTIKKFILEDKLVCQPTVLSLLPLAVSKSTDKAFPEKVRTLTKAILSYVYKDNNSIKEHQKYHTSHRKEYRNQWKWTSKQCKRHTFAVQTHKHTLPPMIPWFTFNDYLPIDGIDQIILVSQNYEIALAPIVQQCKLSS